MNRSQRLTIGLLVGGVAFAATTGQAQQQGGRAGGAAAGAPAAQGRAGGGGGGRGSAPQPQAPQVLHLQQMLAALPDAAPARACHQLPANDPARASLANCAADRTTARRVLVLAKAGGFVHSSIPLAARTIESLGMKTGAWQTVITFNPADINAANLANYDAIYLASTTGSFLDEPNPNNDPAVQAVTDARKKAFLDFVRSGKGVAGVHAATDSYHGGGGRGAAAPAPAAGATAPAPAPAGQGRAAGAAAPAAGAGGGGGSRALWPEFNTMIGGFFKFHWSNGTQIRVKIDDPNNPINAAFVTTNAQGQRTAPGFAVTDEIYTFNQDSWSRKRVHVLTSIDYARMPQEVKDQEPANGRRTDGDYGISYIRREGNGRVFVNVLGHDESIYTLRPMLTHTLAGMQYVLGDLTGVDDSPTEK